MNSPLLGVTLRRDLQVCRGFFYWRCSLARWLNLSSNRGACSGLPEVSAGSQNGLRERETGHSNWQLEPWSSLPIFASPIIRWRLRSEEHTSELQSRGHIVC